MSGSSNLWWPRLVVAVGLDFQHVFWQQQSIKSSEPFPVFYRARLVTQSSRRLWIGTEIQDWLDSSLYVITCVFKNRMNFRFFLRHSTPPVHYLFRSIKSLFSTVDSVPKWFFLKIPTSRQKSHENHEQKNTLKIAIITSNIPQNRGKSRIFFEKVLVWTFEWKILVFFGQK